MEIENKLKKLKELNEMVTNVRGKRDVIVYNPEWNLDIDNHFITKDSHNWNVTDEIKEYIDKISNDKNLSTEMKIIKLYEKMSTKYVYDDNLISYIQKIHDGLYTVPDWYGRTIGEDWLKNRKNHNRRVCYELAREFAGALNILLKDNKDYEICIFWDVEQTHYYVGLTCPDYSLTLDMDDFTGIKDLTRIKAGLTLDGIKIMPKTDKYNIFKANLNKYNESRHESGYEMIKNILSDISKENIMDEDEIDDIEFLKSAMDFISNNLALDSQGIFEYMKEIISCRMGSKAREKIWKKVGDEETEIRYIRCFLVKKGDKTYLVDGDTPEVRQFDYNEFYKPNPTYLPFNNLDRNRERYHGR